MTEAPSEPNKRLMRRAFERAAPDYDAAAVLQQEVGRRLAERLRPIRRAAGPILDAGAGTGNGRPLLHRLYPGNDLIELDIAHAMLLTAQRKRRWQWRLRRLTSAICADLEHLPLADNSVAMVWSNLALQWVVSFRRAIDECFRVLRPSGLLIFSTFGPDTLKELRQAFADIDQQTHLNHFIDMHDAGDALIHAGFINPVLDVDYIRMTYQDVRAVMQDLKTIGAHNVTQGRPKGLMGKTRWQHMSARYDALREEGLLPATFEVIYGHAWRPSLQPAGSPTVHRVQWAQKTKGGAQNT